ncbi:hypothetical protein CY35_15G071900 [Sphagnum magellanicum]|nr:hypothetical protein CY35_15G071900 [Sphagnum magellanicum]
MLMNRSFSRNESGRQGCDNLELGSSKWSLLLMRKRKKNLGSCCCCSNLLVFFFFTLLFLENHRTCALTPDGEALLSFKRGLLETHGAMSNWNESDPDPCGWWGVECHASNRRVSKLNLPYQNLRGPLSPDIGKLDQLRRLGLHRNNLYGPIPQEIGNCTTLKALYLRDNFFTGNIPEELGNLTQLTRLDLSSNGLTGSIPESLGSLFKLTFLNVSTNFLVGEIPTNGILGNCTSNSFMENPGLCGLQVNVPCQSFPPTNQPNGSGVFPPESTPSQTPAAVAGWNAVEGGSSLRKSASYSNGLLISAMSTVAVSLLVAVICCIGWIVYKKRCNNYNQVLHGNGSEANVGSMLVMFHGDLPYTSTEIVKRIENLDDTDIIGSGGFGTVYRLVMDDGCMFAVKAIGKQGTGSERLFARELGILGSFKHRNLVNLRGYCNAPAANLLIYDYVPNGSLEQHLHELEAHQEKLSWTARMRIAQGSARGLAYLHHDCCPRIIHRDIKSSNILLDDCMEPHVADFGLAKLLEDNDSHVTTIVAGTFGYLAPGKKHLIHCQKRVLFSLRIHAKWASYREGGCI